MAIVVIAVVLVLFLLWHQYGFWLFWFMVKVLALTAAGIFLGVAVCVGIDCTSFHTG